jgi:DNA-directed RNA polymerase subunit RPC12/RpoP
MAARTHNPGEVMSMQIEFECPSCRQHLSATGDQTGTTAACPNCDTPVAIPNTTMLPPPVPVPAELQTSPVSQGTIAQKRRSSEFRGKGALVQLLAVVLFFLIASYTGGLSALVVAATLFFIGSYMSMSWVCGTCGNKLSHKNVEMCPTCRSTFAK